MPGGVLGTRPLVKLMQPHTYKPQLCIGVRSIHVKAQSPTQSEKADIHVVNSGLGSARAGHRVRMHICSRICGLAAKCAGDNQSATS